MSQFAHAIARLETLADGTARRLDGSDGHAPSWHLWKKSEVNAISAALAAQRPLLVRGEPGTGKSQLARAAAAALNWHLHTSTLHARSEAQDLLYQFDAVRRLADAQIQQLNANQNAYWQPQALWKALNWESAHDYGSLRQDRPNGAKPPAKAGHVVLIDEIDKAPSDVPNGLLEVLGARRFEIPAIPLTVAAHGLAIDGNDADNKATSEAWPLVIITTNEERELPAAFLRRCMVLTHNSEYTQGYAGFLIEHGLAHFGPKRECLGSAANPPGYLIAPDLLTMAASQLAEDRERAQYAQLTPPGLAEYLDLLYALHRLAPGNTAAQTHWLTRLNQYAYLKNRIDDHQDPLQQNSATGERAISASAPASVSATVSAPAPAAS
jgi:MoxR-like ATPase